MKYLVNENCIACGLCASICPEVFQLNDDGFAEAIDEAVSPEVEYTSIEAKESCPVDAIEDAED